MAKGRRSIIALNRQYKHKTDVSYLYRDAFLSIIRAYIIKRRFLRFSRAAYLPSMQNTRLKTVICARRAVQNIMIICLLLCMARGAAALLLLTLLRVFCFPFLLHSIFCSIIPSFHLSILPSFHPFPFLSFPSFHTYFVFLVYII